MDIQYQTMNNELRIYPNPAKDFVTIKCKGVIELLVIDYLGREVFNKRIINNQFSIINVHGLE